MGCRLRPRAGADTLAMLLREQMSDYVFRNVWIHATDVDAQFAAQITSGIYAAQEVQLMPAAMRERYFQPADKPGFVQVVDEIRQKVSFAEHDLLCLRPPREDFSLILCKNVLLHFNQAQRREVFCMFHRSLRPGGLLATEHTQKMPEDLHALFEPAASYAQIFRRREATENVPEQSNESHWSGIGAGQESESLRAL